MNTEEQRKQVDQLKQTIAESKFAIETLRKVIVQVELRLKKIEPETEKVAQPESMAV